MKKQLIIIALLLAVKNIVYADFKEHYDLGQQYLTSFQYSGAITEFKNALRINYKDNSARIGLINSYISRAAYYANTENNYKKAADDYRSAIFYIVYYPQNKNNAQALQQINSYLNICLNRINYDMTPQNRYNTAKQLRAEGNFSAAGYEFSQSIGDRNLQKDSFEQIGDIMKLLGNNEKAAEFYRKAVAIAPTDIQLRMLYAKTIDSLGQDEEAVKEYNYVLTRVSENDKEILYTLEKIYKKKLANFPEDTDITANLGAIMQKQGNFDEALMYYQKSEYLNPSNINTRLNVGTLYQQKGDMKTAIKAYDSILILEPDNINANLYKAQANASLGNSKEAIESYKKVLSIDPANTEAQTQMLELVKGSMTTAQFSEYIKKNFAATNSAELFYNYALDLHKQNKYDDAIAMYNESIKQDSTNAEVYINLAIAQNQNNQQEKALETLKNAKNMFPDNTQITDAINSVNNDLTNIKLTKAADYYDKKDYKSAIQEYTSIQPANIDSLLGIASCYQALENNDKAIEYYKAAFKLKPTDSDIAYYIAVLYAEKEDWDTTKAYLNKALAINKNNQKAAEFMISVTEQINNTKLNDAIALYDQAKYDNALSLINEILSSDSKNSYALYYRGMINDTKERRQDAINDFKKAYEYNNDLKIVNYLIAIDYDSLGKYKEARQYYQKYTSLQIENDEYKQYAISRADELKDYAK